MTEKTEKQENEQLVMEPQPEPTPEKPKRRGRPRKTQVEQQPGQLVPVAPAEVDPMMQIMQFAIEKDADPDQLKGLVEVQIRWREYKAKEAFYTAFWHLKEEPELKILKDQLVDFQSKRTGGRTNYKFAALDNAETVLIPLLAKHGLAHSWKLEPAEGGWTRVTCVISHYLGHRQAEASLLGPPDETGSKNFHQAIGSNVSFLERYTLCASVGVTPRSLDTDAMVNGNGEESESAGNGYDQDQTPILKESLKQLKERQMRACKTMDEMQAFWKSLTKEEAIALTGVKNEMKLKLTGVPNGQN
jgi:hypothetical protein